MNSAFALTTLLRVSTDARGGRKELTSERKGKEMMHAAPSLHLRLRNEPFATMALRQGVDRLADEHGLPQDARFDLKLAATEAVANALVGAPSDHVVDVFLGADNDALQVEVRDRGGFRPQVRNGHVLESEGGRGIPLMLALVDEVEFKATSAGTRVRMRKRLLGR
jgi:anti-sigma regulatory factor (Ser/Thr protein kinase)